MYEDKQRNNSKYRVKLLENPTKSEIIFKNRLDNFNVRYLFQKGFIKGNCHCIVDFYIPKGKLCIEIDGGYHNNRKGYDKRRDKYLTDERGFKVIRIKNEEVETYDIEKYILNGL